MTLISYSSEQLDKLALRVLDIATQIRTMAANTATNELSTVDIHEKKAMEWLDKLEIWAHDMTDRIDRELIRLRGARRAATLPAAAPVGKPRGRKKKA